MHIEYPATPNTLTSVLAIGAHPDDIELGCGGSVARLAAAKVHVRALNRAATSRRGMPMWWREVLALRERFAAAVPDKANSIDSSATIEPGVELDDSAGPIIVGAGARICSGAVIRGPVFIDNDAMIGNAVMIRGPVIIGSGVRIGYASELKQALIGDRVSIGPMCFVADSKVDSDVYLGAMVRTSNQRLDRAPISVMHGDVLIETGATKLGCWIARGASLGIQVIVLPGRCIAPGALFEPRVTIAKNLPSGHYRGRQELETVSPKDAQQ